MTIVFHPALAVVMMEHDAYGDFGNPLTEALTRGSRVADHASVETPSFASLL